MKFSTAPTVNGQQPTGRAPGAPFKERGIALLLAITILAALGLMSLTGLVLARAERVAGLGAMGHVQARAAAEAALAEAMQGWPVASSPLAPGQKTQLVDLEVPGPAAGQASVRSLGGSVYALQASGVRLSLAGDTLGLVHLEMLVLLEGPDSVGRIHPRPYPRGWRVLP